jgi:phage repressor protein C with HTH and peptisase S24 domain
METTVKQRLEKFLEYKNISKSEFGRVIGVSSAYISSMRKSITPDKAESIALNYPDLNIQWLITGNGQMLIEREKQFRDAKKDVLPLIPYPAIGGYTEDNWTALLNDCPLYAIPDIKTPADFLIKVGGDSMNPKYQEGDLLACKMIQEILFFQWGKTYVLDTSQGVMVKNVYEDKDNPDNILLVSENSEKYPPFAIPRKDIRKIALVVGSLRIRLEM